MVVLFAIGLSTIPAFSDETILVYGEVDQNTIFTEKELNKVLRKLYETELFENVNVRIDNSILKINVSEYQSISSLKFNGEKYR